MSIEIKDRETGEVLFSLGYSKAMRMWFIHEKKRGLLRNPPLIMSGDELKRWLDGNPRADAQVLSNKGNPHL